MSRRTKTERPRTTRASRPLTRRAFVRLAAAGTVAAVAAPVIIGRARGATVVRIGSIQSVTGPSAAPGTRARDGALLALKEIKAAGGFTDAKGNPYTIEFENEDMGNDPKQAITLFRQHSVDPRTVAVLGPTTSVGFLPCIPVAAQIKTPLLGNGSGAPVRNWNTWAYRVNPVAQTATPILLKKVVEVEKLKRLAVIYESTQDGQKGDAEVVRDQQPKLGYDLVAFEAFRTGDQDFSPQIANVKNARPEAIYVAAQHGEGGKLVTQIRSAGIGVPILNGYGSITYGVYWDTSSGGVKGGYTWLGVDVASAKGKLKDWIAEYNRTFPVEATSESVYGYDSLWTVVECIKRTGSTDREKIHEILQTLEFTSPLGTRVTFRNPPHGDNLTPSATIVRVTGRAAYQVVG